MQNEVILEVGVVAFPEMRELVYVVVRLQGVVFVQVEASYHFFSHEIHDENVSIFATNGDQSALRVEFNELSVYFLEDHGGVLGEDDLV